MRLNRILPVTLILFFASACAELGEEPPAPETAVEDVRQDWGPGKLPAYPLPGERYGKKPGKADQFDDYRFAKPENYAITEAPQLGNWRHMREWDQMQALLLSASEGWSTNHPEMKQFFADIAAGTTPVAEVWVVYDNNGVKTAMEAAFADAGADMEKVKWFNIPNDSIWMIDFGPMPIVDEDNEKVAFVDWNYYHERPQDDGIASILAQDVGVTTYRYQNNMEGGNFQGDGKEHCYISQRGLQYSGLPKPTFEKGHLDYLNCPKVTYLYDITNDGTGHIDMFFKQTAYDAAIMGYYKHGVDATNQKRMDDNTELLEALVLDDGGTMKVHRMIMPGLGYEKQAGGKLKSINIPFTYVNSTLINGVNLWPAFSWDVWDESKAEALAVWEEALPDYKHIDIVADEVSLASGAIHCITRTIPAEKLEKIIPDGACLDDTCVPETGFEELAYTGKCLSIGCVGPAWKCDCNDCNSDCKEPDPTEDPCKGVSFEGCCEGDTLTWCQDKQLRTQDCDAATCGWDGGNNFYNCGTEGGASPDTEKFPHQCGGGTECTPTCADDQQCGDDGCGGSCGDCGEGASCYSGKCKADAPPCEHECDGIGSVGCTDDGKTWLCSSSQETGCYVQIVGDVCANGGTCVAGKCEAGPEDTGDDTIGTGDDPDGTGAGTGADDDDGGGRGGGGGTCTAAGHGSVPATGTFVLLLLTGLAIIRRRLV